MDALRAYVLILHAKVERDALRRHIGNLEQEKQKMVSPKLRGIRSALDRFNHTVDFESEKLTSKITAAESTVAARLQETGKKIDTKLVAPVYADIEDVHQFIDELDKLTNAGPSAEGGSDKPSPEPQKSWNGGKA